MATRTVNIGAYAARFAGRMSKFKKGVLIKLFGAVIKDTPVLTGRLRGNWKFGKSTAPSADTTTAADPSGTNATSAMVAGVQSGVTEKDDSYFLENSMPYAGRIEYEGWSHTKAPQGMVRKNMTRIAKLLEDQAST